MSRGRGRTTCRSRRRSAVECCPGACTTPPPPATPAASPPPRPPAGAAAAAGPRCSPPLPLHGDGGAERDTGDVGLEGGQHEDVVGGGHAEEQAQEEEAEEGGVDKAAGREGHVRQGLHGWVATAAAAGGIPLVDVLVVDDLVGGVLHCGHRRRKVGEVPRVLAARN